MVSAAPVLRPPGQRGAGRHILASFFLPPFHQHCFIVQIKKETCWREACRCSLQVTIKRYRAELAGELWGKTVQCEHTCFPGDSDYSASSVQTVLCTCSLQIEAEKYVTLAQYMRNLSKLKTRNIARKIKVPIYFLFCHCNTFVFSPK